MKHLLIDVEPSVINNNALLPNIIAATGETDVRADETFNYTQISSKLGELGYTLISGSTYYFSLRKTWNITSGNITYEITRTCEPIQVIWP